MPARMYRFAGFSLDPQARELREGERLLQLPVSAFDCLAYLIDARQRVVGRDELISAVWGRTDVSEKLLSQTVVRIRRTLGDTIDEPRYVRTVARFGYRWIAETEDIVAADAPPALADPGPQPSTGAQAISGTPARGRLSRRLLATVALIFIVVLGIVLSRFGDRWLRSVRAPAASSAAAALGMVLPAKIEAADRWSWLHLGLMDLVATRLRRGGIATLSSESVVGLLKRAPPDDPDAQPALPPHDLEVRPSAIFDAGQWIVRLDAHGKNGPISTEARSTDVLASARSATDALLLKLGHAPPDDSDAPPQALAELLQRASAAALGERFQYAANLIDQAPEQLRQAPDLGVLRALIEIRSGEYAAAAQRIRLLLDRPSATLTRTTRARALNALGAIEVREDHAEDAVATYDEAIALLVDQKAPGVLGYAYQGRGMAALMRDDMDAALANLGRARVEMEAAGDRLGGAIVELDLGQVQLRQRRPAEALVTLRAAESRLDRYGAREELVYTRLLESEAQMRLLDIAGALATTATFSPADTATGNQRLRWRLVLARARALAMNGRLKEADALIERIRQQADPREDSDLRLETEVLAADIELERGRPEDAERLAARATTDELERDDPDLYMKGQFVLLCALLAQRHFDRAAARAGQLRLWLSRHDDAWHHAYSSFASALLENAEGNRDAALSDFADAAARIRTSAQPRDVVAVTQPYVLALIDAGRLDEATEVIARIGAFAESDFDVAWANARLYAALGREDAHARAGQRAALLAGDRTLPDRAAAGNP